MWRNRPAILHDAVRFLSSCGPLKGSPATQSAQQQQQQQKPQPNPQLQLHMHPEGTVINGQQLAVMATAAVAVNGASAVPAAAGAPATHAASAGGGEALPGGQAGPAAEQGKGDGAATLMQRLTALAVSVNEGPSLRHTAFMLLQVRTTSILRFALPLFSMESRMGSSPCSQAWSDRETSPRPTGQSNSHKDHIFQGQDY